MPDSGRGYSSIHAQRDGGAAARTSPSAAGLALTWLVVSIVTGGLLVAASPAHSQALPSLAIDAQTDLNSSTHVERIDTCVSVQPGDEFPVDIVIEDVEELLAWELYVDFDAETLDVVDRDVKLFLAGNEGSNVIDVSSRLPSPPPYRLSAADISDPPTPDSGSGVLARITFRAKAPGESTISFARTDLNDDGKLDVGPFLRNDATEPVGDTDGDIYFDGNEQAAVVAVGVECSDVSTPLPESGSSGGWNWAVVGVGGAVLAAGALGASILVISRLRSRTPQELL
jgi:hypothetical protein